MDNYKKLADYLRRINRPTTSILQGIVKSVQGETCSVEIGNITISDVKLKATSTKCNGQILITPKVNTAVVIGSLSGNLEDLAVLSVDEAEKIEIEKIESITINGGKLGGMINIEALTEKINDLIATFNSHTHSVTVAHPGGVFETVATTSQAASLNKTDYEDPKIKH